MIKRTYENQNNFLNKKDFVRRKYGEYFDNNPFRDGYDINKETQYLSTQGKTIINKFIEQNIKKEIEKRKEEHDRGNKTTRKIRKKEPIWVKTMHRIEYFGGPLIDYKYEFIKPKSAKPSINQPGFRRPKEKGDYFNNYIDVFGISKKYFS